jgi:citrate lyase subunit beta/citryl-CoA lyase
MDPARSLLFVPANRERFLEKARTLPADAILLDLEDAVPVAEKAAAREMARGWIGRYQQPVWVRVNGAETDELVPDADALVGVPGLAGLMLPKADRVDTLVDLDARLRELERDRGVALGSIQVIAQIESALGVLRAFEIASAPRVVSVCLGGARGGDLQTDLGAEWSIDGPELMYTRQHVLLAARAAGVAWPLDGVFGEVADQDGFERDSTLSRRLGYRGRTVIHPTQVELANRIYAPSDADIEEAGRIVREAAAAEAEGRGTVLVDGRLVDRAMVRRARQVIDLRARLVSGSAGGSAIEDA